MLWRWAIARNTNPSVMPPDAGMRPPSAILNAKIFNYLEPKLLRKDQRPVAFEV